MVRVVMALSRGDIRKELESRLGAANGWAFPWFPPYSVVGRVDQEAFVLWLKPNPPWIHFVAVGHLGENSLEWEVKTRFRTLLYYWMTVIFLFLFSFGVVSAVLEGAHPATFLTLGFPPLAALVQCLFHRRAKAFFTESVKLFFSEFSGNPHLSEA